MIVISDSMMFRRAAAWAGPGPQASTRSQQWPPDSEAADSESEGRLGGADSDSPADHDGGGRGGRRRQRPGPGLSGQAACQ
jgi:hypothetical protein